MKKQLIVLAGSLLALSVSASAQTLPIALPNFSADVQMLNKGQVFSSGKFYMGSLGVRMEMNHAGMPMTVIDRLDKGVMWMLMGNQKMYMEQPMPFDPMVKHEVPAGWTQTCSAGETIDNHPTEKCALSGPMAGKTITTTIWKAKDLNGAVIQNLNDQGAGMQLKNIVVGPQPAALFEPPSDYKKMNIPAAISDKMKKLPK